MTRDNGQIAADWDQLYEFYRSQGYSDETASQLANEGIFNAEKECDKDFEEEENVCPVCDGVGDLEETCSECYYCQGAGYL